MIDWSTLAIQTLMTVGAGAAGAAAIQAFANRNMVEASAEVELAKRRNTDATTNNQVVETARSLVAGVEADMVRVRKEMKDLRQEFEGARTENLKLRAAVQAYRDRTAHLEDLIRQSGIAVDQWIPPAV